MSKDTSLVPGAASEPEVVAPLVPLAEDVGLEEKYFTPDALALVRSLENKKASDLSDDETLMLALIAAQAALAKYIHPGHRSAERTLDTILSVLDNRQVVCASLHKAQELLSRQKRQPAVGGSLPPDRRRRLENPYFP
jgi:hypothetical protein